MKKIILILCLVNFTFIICNAQKSSKRKYNSYSNTKKEYEDPNDSAYMYYNLGWDAYKLKDYCVARYYWEHGANCNTDAPSRFKSAFRIGLLHQEGQCVDVNFDIAYYYFTLGWADGKKVGEVEATKNIAAYYEMGRVVPKDMNKALEWYQKSKEQGNRYCDKDIARCKSKISKNNY